MSCCTRSLPTNHHCCWLQKCHYSCGLCWAFRFVFGVRYCWRKKRERKPFTSWDESNARPGCTFTSRSSQSLPLQLDPLKVSIALVRIGVHVVSDNLSILGQEEEEAKGGLYLNKSHCRDQWLARARCQSDWICSSTNSLFCLFVSISVSWINGCCDSYCTYTAYPGIVGRNGGHLLGGSGFELLLFGHSHCPGALHWSVDSAGAVRA